MAKKASQRAAAKPEKDSPSEVDALSRLHIWQIQAFRDILVVAAAVGIIWTGHALRAVTVPLLVALMLAYLFEPLITRICDHPRLRFTRVQAVAAILLTVGGTVALVIALTTPLVVGQTTQIVNDFRDGTVRQRVSAVGNYMPESLRDSFDSFVSVLPSGKAAAQAEDIATPAPAEQPGAAMDEARVRELIDERIRQERALLDDGDGTDFPLSSVSRGAHAIGAIIGSLVEIGLLTFLIPFYFFFFAVWYPDVVRFGRELLPTKNRERTLELLEKMDQVVSGFVRGRIVISIIMGIMLAIGWAFCGVPYAIVLGLVIGVFCAVPYLGGIGVPIALALLFFEQINTPADARMSWWFVVIAPTAVFAVVQLIEGYVLTPAIAGKVTNLDPVTILVAVLAGGSIMGVYGMLLSIPVAACGKILLREVLMPRIKDWTAGRVKDPLPINRE